MAMTRAQLRHVAACQRYQADRKRPPTRKQAKAWLAPIRNAIAEIRTGEVAAFRGYPITRIHWADEDFARIDHAINGFVSLMDRLMSDIDTWPMKRMAKKLETGVLMTLDEVDECAALLYRVEDRLVNIPRETLVDAANTEMILIELERKNDH